MKTVKTKMGVKGYILRKKNKNKKIKKKIEEDITNRSEDYRTWTGTLWFFIEKRGLQRGIAPRFLLLFLPLKGTTGQ